MRKIYSCKFKQPTLKKEKKTKVNRKSKRKKMINDEKDKERKRVRNLSDQSNYWTILLHFFDHLSVIIRFRSVLLYIDRVVFSLLIFYNFGEVIKRQLNWVATLG